MSEKDECGAHRAAALPLRASRSESKRCRVLPAPGPAVPVRAEHTLCRYRAIDSVVPVAALSGAVPAASMSAL